MNAKEYLITLVPSLQNEVIEDMREFTGEFLLYAMTEFANQSKWISNKTMPENDGKYLCIVEQRQTYNNVRKYQRVIDYCIFNNWVTWDSETVTHWQTLPTFNEK